MSITKPRIVRIYTAEKEQEIDGVIDLISESVDVHRCNLCNYPGRLQLTQSSNSPLDRGFSWVHRIPPFSSAPTYNSLAREASLKESLSYFENLWLLTGSDSWMNSPDSLWKASKKIYQLYVARRLGIPVPDWIYTNSLDQITEFRRRIGPIVLKSAALGYIESGPDAFKFYTVLATDALLEELARALPSPMIAQRCIDKKWEFRITVVDSSTYVCSIDYSKLPESTIDYREIDFEAHRDAFRSLPHEMHSKAKEYSLSLCNELGLKFAGIDWITDGRELYFLECNSMPAFRWYENFGDRGITEHLARLILNEL